MHRRHPKSEIGIIQTIVTNTEYITEIRHQKKEEGDPTNTLLPEYGQLYSAAEAHGIQLTRQGMHDPKDPARIALIAKFGPGSDVHRAFHRIDLFTRAPNAWSSGSASPRSPEDILKHSVIDNMDQS